jgi:hypothetical protein
VPGGWSWRLVAPAGRETLHGVAPPAGAKTARRAGYSGLQLSRRPRVSQSPTLAATAPPDPGAERVRGRLMAASLATLLDGVRGAREALPHLAALEASLARHGASAIEALPERWRRRLGAQLGSLPLPPDDAPLLDLVRRLQAMPAAGDAAAAPAPAAPTRPWLADPAFDPERTVVVREISHSEFMDLAEGKDRVDDGR